MHALLKGKLHIKKFSMRLSEQSRQYMYISVRRLAICVPNYYASLVPVFLCFGCIRFIIAHFNYLNPNFDSKGLTYSEITELRS